MTLRACSPTVSYVALGKSLNIFVVQRLHLSKQSKGTVTVK